MHTHKFHPGKDILNMSIKAIVCTKIHSPILEMLTNVTALNEVPHFTLAQKI